MSKIALRKERLVRPKTHEIFGGACADFDNGRTSATCQTENPLNVKLLRHYSNCSSTGEKKLETHGPVIRNHAQVGAHRRGNSQRRRSDCESKAQYCNGEVVRVLGKRKNRFLEINVPTTSFLALESKFSKRFQTSKSHAAVSRCSLRESEDVNVSVTGHTHAVSDSRGSAKIDTSKELGAITFWVN